MRVLTVGTFDLFHSGHVNFLWACYKISGAYLVGNSSPENHVTVGLNTDEFIERFKGKKPVYSYFERRAILSNSKYVWNTLENKGNEDLKVFIDSLKYEPPQALVVGSDWAKKDYFAQTQLSQEYLDRKGILLIYVPYTEGISTTLLKERILNSE